jgi:hypothetical protein
MFVTAWLLKEDKQTGSGADKEGEVPGRRRRELARPQLGKSEVSQRVCEWYGIL